MRTSILFFFSVMFALAQTPTFTPSAPIATAGQSISVSSSANVTWSLSGAGTLSNQTATSVTYTAPSSIVAQSQMLGCPVFPDDAIFNTRIDSLPVNANSATWIAHMSSVNLTFLPSWGITYADASTPTQTFKPYYGNGSSFPSYANWPFPGRGPGLKRESGNYVGVTGYINQADHHTLTVRTNDCTFFELYDDRINFETFACGDGSPGCNSNSANAPYGWFSGANPYAMPLGTTDAAGLPLSALSYHLDEVKLGAIKHAVRFTASNAYINGVTWPAVDQNAFGPNAPPYGARLRLRTPANGGPNPTTVCTQNSVLNQDCVTILTALQQYGMMLADIGGNNEIETTSDMNEDATTRAAMAIIAAANITPSSFDIVDESSLRPQTANGFQSANSYAVDPNNGYVTPVNYALITATTTSGVVTKIPIALQATAIGIKSNALAIVAGTWGSYQLQCWVNPSSMSQSVTWSLASGVGSVTSGGLYTPPANTTGGTSAVLRVTAAADPNVVNYVYVSVLQPGSNPTGAIRIDTGSNTGVTDGSGNIWLPDQGFETGVSPVVASDYPSWVPGNPEHAVYESSRYTYGDDITYRIALANGNYKIRYMFGEPWNGAASPKGSFPEYFNTAPVFLEAQGVIEAHYFDWNYVAGFQYATPVDAYIPARVTNNFLIVAERSTTPDTAITVASGLAPLYHGTSPYLLSHADNDTKSTLLNGLEIIPDSSTPHWAIDTQQMTTLSPGQFVQLYVVDWYTGDSDVSSPTWSVQTVVPGVAVSSTGLLNLSSSAITNGQPIVVTAKGAKHSASVTLYAAGAAIYAFLPSRPVSHSYFKRTLTISAAQMATAANFPLVVSFTDPTLATAANGGHVQNPNGYDIVPTTDSTCATNTLAYEVESYNPATGAWLAHIRIPSLPNTGNTNITLCYGNPAVQNSLSVPSAVWDSNYTAVYHFASLNKDSTSNMNTTTSNGISQTPGLFGYGALFPAQNGFQSISIPLAAEPVTAGTIEAWVDNQDGQTSTTNWGLYADHEAAGIFQFGIWYNSLMYFGWDTVSAQDYRFTLTGTQIALNSPWNHIVYTWDANAQTQAVYLNGVAVQNISTAFTPFTPTQAASLGADAYNPFKGVMDEVRFSKIARSASWIQTEYANQSAPASFVGFGAEQKN